MCSRYDQFERRSLAASSQYACTPCSGSVYDDEVGGFGNVATGECVGDEYSTGQGTGLVYDGQQYAGPSHHSSHPIDFHHDLECDEGGREAHSSHQDITSDERRLRLQMAHRRMENHSGVSLQLLHKTLRAGIDTTEELEVQAETMDRIERRLDEMDVNLDRSKRHLRNIKSPFGGIANYFSRQRRINDITDPRMPRSTAVAKRKKSVTQEPERPQSSGDKGLKESMGNEVVDDNLDQLETALHQLKGVSVLIGEQLDDSKAQVDRVAVKMKRADVKMKNVNKDIKYQLY